MGWLTPVGLTGPSGDSEHWRAITKQVLGFGLSAQSSVLPSGLSHSLCEDSVALGLAYCSFSVKIRLISRLFPFT